MAILFQTENTSFPNIKRRETKKWIQEVATGYNKKMGNINYLFCNDEKIIAINREYLNHDYYTDIITFDYTDRDQISGDIFISLDTVLSNSKQYHTLYEEELYRVIIHGILHLCGINDKTEEESRLMREAEEKALNLLGDSGQRHLFKSMASK